MIDLFMTDDDIKEAAKRLGANLSLDRGKTKKIVEDLKDKLGRPCPYCSTRISLTNCTYDHATAIGSEKLRKSTGALKRAIDNWDNLQLTCIPCNRTKSDLNHAEYLGLLEYFKQYPGAKRKILERFRKERMYYKSARKRTNR